MSEIKSAAQQRKDIYTRIVEILGRELKEKEHKKIKEAIQRYAKDFGATLVPQKHEHVYVCEKCGGRKEGKGRPFSHRMNQNYKKSLP